MVEVLDVHYRLSSYGYILEHKAINESILHSPEYVGLTQHAGGGDRDVVKGDADQVSWAAVPGRPAPGPGLNSLHGNHPVLKRRPWVLHHYVPEHQSATLVLH